MIKKLKKYLWLFIPFFLCIAIAAIAMIFNKVYPFGDNMIVWSDGAKQILPFVRAFQDTMRNGTNAGFTMNAMFGLDTMALNSYYLFNLYTLLSFVFPMSFQSEVAAIAILLTYGFASVSFAYYAHYYLKTTKFTSILFAIGYGLCGWIVFNSFIFIWNFGFIFLPILCAAIHKLIDQNKTFPLIISFFLIFLSSYYIGYMLALFSVIYFIFLLALNGNQSEIKTYLKKGLILVGCGLLAFLMIAVFIFPSAYTIFSNSIHAPGAAKNFGYAMHRYISIADFIPGLFSGAHYDTNAIKLFVGLLTVIMAISFFLNKKQSMRKKIVFAGLILFMYFTMQINAFNLIWHLTEEPVGFMFRQSFFLCFILLCAGMQSFDDYLHNLKDPQKHIFYASLICLFVILLINGFLKNPLSMSFYAFFILILFAWGFLLYLYKKSTKPAVLQWIKIAFVFLMCLDMGFNISVTYGMFPKESRSAMNQKREEVNSIKGDIEAYDHTMYRMMDTHSLTRNDGLYFDYMTFMHHSSVKNNNAVVTMELVGHTLANYSPPYLVPDSIFGFNYTIPDVQNNNYYKKHTTSSGVEYSENPYALPMIFASNGTSDQFLQDEYFNQAKGGGVQYENGDVWMNKTQNQKLLLDAISRNSGTLLSELPKKQIDNTTYEFTCPKDGPIFYTISYNTAYVLNLDGLLVNGTKLNMKDPNLGEFKAGDIITVDIKDWAEKNKSIERLQLGQLDMSKFAQLMKDIQAKTMYVTRPTSTSFEAKVKAQKDDVLFTTITKSAGWSMTIDGEPAEIKDGLNFCMAADIPEGEHIIRLEYRRPWQKEGYIVSGVAWLIFLALCARSVVKNRKKSKPEQKLDE